MYPLLEQKAVRFLDDRMYQRLLMGKRNSGSILTKSNDLWQIEQWSDFQMRTSIEHRNRFDDDQYLGSSVGYKEDLVP
tara:strand:+ start:435 stop:668 length:234 start_codon:yes stop_codon:yes gene_type:complete